MLGNLIVIAILVLGILCIALATIVILSRYAGKHQTSNIEVNFKMFGCSFGAKASTRDVAEEMKPNVDSTNKPNIIPFKSKNNS